MPEERLDWRRNTGLGGRPFDALVLFEGGPQPGDGFAAAFAWRADPEAVAGELLLTSSGDRISRLEVRVLPGGPARPRERFSVRAVVTAGDRVLLFRCSEPGRDDSWWWITPGSGARPGEDDRAALERELREELGVGLPGHSVPSCGRGRTHSCGRTRR